jgi:hypothetical protein
MHRIEFEELSLMLGSFPVGSFSGHVIYDLGASPKGYPEVYDVVVYSDTGWGDSAKRDHVSLRNAYMTEGSEYLASLLGSMLWKAAAEDTNAQAWRAFHTHWEVELAALAAREERDRPDRLLKSEVV